jgi:hypothetical protein
MYVNYPQKEKEMQFSLCMGKQEDRKRVKE